MYSNKNYWKRLFKKTCLIKFSCILNLANYAKQRPAWRCIFVSNEMSYQALTFEIRLWTYLNKVQLHIHLHLQVLLHKFARQSLWCSLLILSLYHHHKKLNKQTILPILQPLLQDIHPVKTYQPLLLYWHIRHTFVSKPNTYRVSGQVSDGENSAGTRLHNPTVDTS